MPNEQTIGQVESVDEGAVDIMAEQAAAAASTKGEGAAPMKDEGDDTPAPDEGAYVPKPEVTPDNEQDANLADKFKIAQGKKVEEAAKPAAKPTVQPRVLDDLDEPLRPLFKNMSNESFNALKPLILEAKQNKAKVTELTTALEDAKKGKIPDSYYEHDMAYVLTPEFADVSAAVDTAQSVHSHWERQLSDVRSGAESYIPLVRDQQGNIVTGQPIKVDKDTLTKLEGVRNEIQQYYLGQKARLDQIATTHKQQVAGNKAWINDFIANSFPVFAKDEVLKGMVADTVKKFPAHLQSNPMVSLAAHLMVTSAQLGELLKAEKAKNAKPAAAKPQPNAAAIAGGGTGGGPVGLNDDNDLVGAFNAAKKGLL